MGIFRSGADALKPGYLCGNSAIRWTLKMTLEGAGCRKYPFELYTGQYIIVSSIAEFMQRSRIEYLRAGGEVMIL